MIFLLGFLPTYKANELTFRGEFLNLNYPKRHENFYLDNPYCN